MWLYVLDDYVNCRKLFQTKFKIKQFWSNIIVFSYTHMHMLYYKSNFFLNLEIVENNWSKDINTNFIN